MSTQMDTPIVPHEIESVGTVAGLVWGYLHEHGPVTLSKLAREIPAPRDMVMQGVGWLAREEKVHFQPGDDSKLLALRTLP